MKKEKRFVIKYTLRTNGKFWYLIDNKGNIKNTLTDLQVSNLLPIMDFLPKNNFGEEADDNFINNL